ncbi:MAG: hypothetical protein EPO01_02600 [Aquabacterium sp.]|jgi:hypothetical protein|nr:MAG: hypothetical protein EPO12_20745 [Aquabacterium sp.]TAL26104.1 MAG: hypothetical protein EPO01_02600 [Aquabacterium sp.]
MAKAFVDFGGTELSAAVVKTLETKLDGKTVEFKSLNSELDLDGIFVDPVRWQANLWATVSAEVGIKSFGKPRKTSSNIDAPGTYNVEIELWDRTLKFKLKIAEPTDKSQRVIKKNSKAPHVNVRLKGAKLNAVPAAHAEDLKGLIKEMGRTASWTYTGGTGSDKGWTPKFKGHKCHEQPGEGWKAYIEESDLGTKWRLYFEYEFDVPTRTLNVALTKVQQDH